MDSSLKKSFMPEFKMKVALELIRESETMAQVCSKYQIHPTRAGIWKQQVLKGARGIFGDRASEKRIVELESEKAELFSTIGRLTHELDWLKKRA